MKRREFLKSAAASGALAATAPALLGADDKRPNIILLLTDDQSYLSLGCYGATQVKTPNFDRLAGDGVVFDAAYDTTAICMASRAQVMTGMYEYKTGCNFSHGPLLGDKWSRSYPVLLRSAGYHTGFVGKFGFAVVEEDGSKTNADGLPVDSFDEWYGWPGQGSYSTASNKTIAHHADRYPHTTRAVGAVSRDFIKNAKKRDKPFCLSVSFKASHKPFTPDPFFDDVYADTVWQTPGNYDEAGAAHLPEQAKSGRQYQRYTEFRSAGFQETMRKYQQLVHGVDYAVGMIRDELERQGVADNTVILFLTDNGYSCGAHRMGGKVLPYEEPSRSPMIVYDPRHPVSGKGKRSKGVAGNIDMAPTILDLAGLPILENMDGVSLLPLLDDPAASVRDTLLLINAWGAPATHSLAVVSKTHKYIHWPHAEDGMEPAEELYDRLGDPCEMRNVAANPETRPVLEDMRARYDKAVAIWRDECVPTGGYPAFATFYDRNVSWEEKGDATDARVRRGKSIEDR